MKLLKKAENTMAFFKCGFFGFQGSGKTYTATLFAIGICELIKNKKVAFFDTETGSDFLLPMLKKQEIETFQVKSRSFSDLLETIRECETENIPILIIDSITHVWRDLCDAYDKKLKRKGRLQFQDWAILKGEWKEYTDLFVNSRVHTIVCGRAGYEYDYDFNEDGSKDLVKTGTKMKVETEFGFEPSLVIEMERISKNRDEVEKIKNNRAKKQMFSPKIGSEWIHRCHVLKDRTDTLNGKSFDYPTFEDFLPHFQALNIGGEHLGIDTTRTSEDRFDSETGRPEWKQRKINRDIALEKIQATAQYLWPSSSKDDKAKRQEFMEVLFNTRSWIEISEKLPDETIHNTAKYLKRFEEKYQLSPEQPIQIIWDETVEIENIIDQKEPEDIPI